MTDNKSLEVPLEDAIDASAQVTSVFGSEPVEPHRKSIESIRRERQRNERARAKRRARLIRRRQKRQRRSYSESE